MNDDKRRENEKLRQAPGWNIELSPSDIQDHKNDILLWLWDEITEIEMYSQMSKRFICTFI